MSKKSIYIVTHGDKHPGANPGMTEKGFEEIASLRYLVPSTPTWVVCGTGLRHINVAYALRKIPTRYTAVVGGPESVEIIKGRKVVILANGTQVDHYQYTGVEDETEAMTKLVINLSDNSIICAGRPAMIMLGHTEAKSAAVHKVTVENGQVVGFEIITH